MTNRQSLYEMMKRKASCLCVGLDPDSDRIPAHKHEALRFIISYKLWRLVMGQN